MSALRAISAATQTFAETTTDYERLLERIVHAVAGLVPDTCVITLVDESGTLTNVAAWDDDPRVVELFAATLNKPRARVPSATVEQADAGTRFVPEFWGGPRGRGARPPPREYFRPRAAL